jgi:FMN-dependent NADH-azoreductase
MAKLLYIESSPRKERSASIAVSHQFLDAYRAAHPSDTVETLDLWDLTLPRFDSTDQEAKYAVMQGQTFTPEQKQSRDAVVKVAEHFKSADKYLISLPMWNFGIPYILKHYIDVLVQPGLTFSFSPEKGYSGLVTGKPAVAIYARGGAYGAGTGAEGYDQQTRYLQQVLGFIGFTDVKSILVEPTLAGPAAKDQAIAKAGAEAVQIAKAF